MPLGRQEHLVAVICGTRTKRTVSESNLMEAAGPSLPSGELLPGKSRGSNIAPLCKPDPDTACLARATAETNFFRISLEQSALRAKRRFVRRWFSSILLS